jgi:hypothetical protein
MAASSGLVTADILAIFEEEIGARGGTVKDTYHDGTRLFTRSVLPQAREVGPKDRVQGGVALKATAEEAWVHPYVFRLVCKNGAIMAQATQTRHLTDLQSRSWEGAANAVREAVRDCCAEEAFAESARQMRSAREADADRAISMLPLLSNVLELGGHDMATLILDQFFREGDQTRFGLMNAVTAVARDTREPELRWRLEELGGGIAVGWTPTPVRITGAAEALPEREVPPPYYTESLLERALLAV